MADSKVIESSRYKAISRLGAGGMSVVYKCRDTTVKRLVAIKLLQENPSDKMVARLQTEARAIAKLEHQNIVKVLDFGQLDNGRLFLSMEYIEGEDLGSRLKREKAIRLSQAIPLLMQICQGMRHSHGQGVLHRDIKPSNVLLQKPLKTESSSQVKLVDFGIAKIEGVENQHLTHKGASIGSPPYMSPENIRGQEVSKTSDIYSFGCLMFEILTGTPPFLGDTAAQTMMLHTNEPAPSLESASEIEFPAMIEKVVAKCLRKEPAERYQSFEEIIEDLIKYEEAGEITDREAEKTEGSKTNQFQNSSLTIALVAVTVLLAVTAFYFSNQSGKNDRPDKKTAQPDLNIKVGELGIKSSIDSMADAKPYLRPRKGQLPGSYQVVGSIGPEDYKIEFLKDKKGLSQLIFSMDNLKGEMLEPIAGKPLRSLRLMESELDEDSFKYIAKIKTLKVLDLLQCYGFQNQDLKYLAALSELEQFALERSIVNNVGIVHILKLKKLKKLSLSDSHKLNFSFLADLNGFPNLVELSLLRNKIGKDNFEKLRELKRLRVLKVTELPENYLSVLSDLNLKILEIKDSATLSDKKALSLLQIPSLENLRFSRCKNLSSSLAGKIRAKRPDIAFSIKMDSRSELEEILVPGRSLKSK